MPAELFSSPLKPNHRVTEEEAVLESSVSSMERATGRLDRRSFMTAVAAAAAVMGTVGYSKKAAAQTAPAITDVLNFALNLEYLEANFYIAASGATPLSSADMGSSPGAVTFPPIVMPVLDTTTLAVAQALAQDERNHIEQLRSAITTLGGTPISQPAIDLSGGTGFAVQSEQAFLALARVSVGNAAYSVAAQYLISNTTVLSTAAHILGAEAQHLGAISYLCDINGIPGVPFDSMDYPSGANEANIYFDVTPTSDTSGPAFGPARTTSQVLEIVYGLTLPVQNPMAGVTKGGFFPNGMNGNIVST